MATLKFVSNSNSKKPIIHKGKEGCMNIALYIKGSPQPGEPIKAADVVLTNGKSPQPGDTMICGSCGKNLKTLYAVGWCE